MINLNTAIEPKINQFILETQKKFSQVKSDSLASLQTEVANITQETNTLQEELNQKLSQPDQAQLKDQIGTHTTKLLQTIDLLSIGKSSEDAIDVLTQEIDSLVKEITTIFDANSTDSDLPKLKQKLTAWQTRVKDTLVKFSAIVESHQKNELLINNLKDTLSRYGSIPEVDEPFEKLIKEFKDNFTQLQEASILFQTLDDLTNEIKARDEAIKLNQRIDALIERTKEQVARFSKELDREVQGELAKLIKILGMAQVELMKSSEPCSVMQVKSVVDYGEIAINSLTGQPNIILAQKLRYAAKTGLRKIHRGCLYRLADFRDNIFHSFKIPTKVLIGLLLAFPANWVMMKFSPVNELLSLPPVIKSSSQNTQGENSPNTEPPIIKSSNQNTQGEGNQNTQGEGNQSTQGEGNQNTQGENSSNTKDGVIKIIRLVWITGTLGGGVSLLTRLQDFDNPKNQKYNDDFLPFAIGLTKPILGGSFAFFILLILKSNIFPIEIRSDTGDKGNDTDLYGLLAMAFVAGFSERLIPDLISQVEKKVIVEASSTGRGLPPTISIAPSKTTLALNESKEFTISPVGNYTITISPPNVGTIDKTPTDAKFTYTAPSTAPSTGNAENQITITVTSVLDSAQTATATVTLKIA
jgi:hypothetical protein